jgi:hypothetical protein
MDEKYINIINEVSEEYKKKGIQDIIFQPDNNDLFWIYRQILEEDLKPGNIIKIRFDWCKEDKFKVVQINVEKGQEELFKNIGAGKSYIKNESILFVKDDSLEEFIGLFEKSYNFKSDNSRNKNNTAENSVLDIHLILDNDNNLHVVRYEILRATTDNLESHSKNCNSDDFLVYDNKEEEARTKEEAEARAKEEAEARAKEDEEARARTKEEAEARARTKEEAEANAKGFEINDEPDSDSESISGESSGKPLDKKTYTRQDESESVIKQKTETALLPKIFEKINAVEKILREFNNKNYNNEVVFNNFDNKIEELLTYINKILYNDLFLNVDSKNDLNLKKHSFNVFKKNYWGTEENPTVYQLSIIDKFNELNKIIGSQQSFPFFNNKWNDFFKKKNELIDILKELYNYINVNLYDSKYGITHKNTTSLIRGGRKTKRRSRKIFSKNKRTKRHRKTINRR